MEGDGETKETEGETRGQHSSAAAAACQDDRALQLSTNPSHRPKTPLNHQPGLPKITCVCN